MNEWQVAILIWGVVILITAIIPFLYFYKRGGKRLMKFCRYLIGAPFYGIGGLMVLLGAWIVGEAQAILDLLGYALEKENDKYTKNRKPVFPPDGPELASFKRELPEFKGFLHRHPGMESKLGVPDNHVIVDKEEWRECRSKLVYQYFYIRETDMRWLYELAPLIMGKNPPELTYDEIHKLLRFRTYCLPDTYPEFLKYLADNQLKKKEFILEEWKEYRTK